MRIMILSILMAGFTGIHAYSYKVTMHADGGYENCFVDAVDAFTCNVVQGPVDHP